MMDDTLAGARSPHRSATKSPVTSTAVGSCTHCLSRYTRLEVAVRLLRRRCSVKRRSAVGADGCSTGCEWRS